MKYISIVPIFDQQDPFIWASFAGIQSAAMSALRYQTVPQEMALNIIQFKKTWTDCQPCFAFAAYNGDKMIGCIHGVLRPTNAFINGLYVLPEYQKMGIGAKLLAISERAASVYTNTMMLQAISNINTVKFYRRHNYTVVEPRNGLTTKDITGLWHNKTVPMFFCSDAVGENCSKIAQQYGAKFNIAAVNRAHLPMFAHLNANSSMAGYILGKSDGNQANVHVDQLYLADMARADVVRYLMENMATMNVR